MKCSFVKRFDDSSTDVEKVSDIDGNTVVDFKNKNGRIKTSDSSKEVVHALKDQIKSDSKEREKIWINSCEE